MIYIYANTLVSWPVEQPLQQQIYKRKKPPTHKLNGIKTERVARRDHGAYNSTFGFYFVFIVPFVPFHSFGGKTSSFSFYHNIFFFCSSVCVNVGKILCRYSRIVNYNIRSMFFVAFIIQVQPFSDAKTLLKTRKNNRNS